MTLTTHTVQLTNHEISTILYHLEAVALKYPDELVPPEIDSIFEKLENVPVA